MAHDFPLVVKGDELDDEYDPSTGRSHLRGRVDPLTSAVLVFPLLLVYQLGILSGRGQNGVDFVTRTLIDLARRDLTNYLWLLGGALAVYAAILVILGGRGRFHPRAFLPVVVESSVYALVMGTLIMFVMNQFARLVPGLSVPALSVPGLAISTHGPLDILVISAGAGFHEEFLFRLGLMGGLSWLMTGVTGPRRAWMVALVLSSLLFSLAHHIGPAGEAFSFAAFVYRALAGAFFALLYQLRGFAVAVWTHAIYDVYVLSLA